jgi:hypothetical protein
VEQEQQQRSSLQLQNPTDYRHSGERKLENLPSSSYSQHQKFQKFQTSSSSVKNPIRKTHRQVLSKGASSWGKKETGAVELPNQSLPLPPPKKTQE